MYQQVAGGLIGGLAQAGVYPGRVYNQSNYANYANIADWPICSNVVQGNAPQHVYRPETSQPKPEPKETVLDSIKKLMVATPTVVGEKLVQREEILVNVDLGGF